MNPLLGADTVYVRLQPEGSLPWSSGVDILLYVTALDLEEFGRLLNRHWAFNLSTRGGG